MGNRPAAARARHRHPAQDRRSYGRRFRLAGGGLAAIIALAASAVGLVLNELTGQSLVVFRYVLLVGPVSAFLVGYALTPALLAGRKFGRLSVVWTMALATLVSGIVLSAGVVSYTGMADPPRPFEPLIWTVVLTLVGLLYAGIPMLVLIFVCAVIWTRLTRRLLSTMERDRSRVVVS